MHSHTRRPRDTSGTITNSELNNVAVVHAHTRRNTVDVAGASYRKTHPSGSEISRSRGLATAMS